MDDSNFQVQPTDIFSLKPDSNFFGSMASVTLPVFKETLYSKETRSTLFGGLTSSMTANMEVSLNIPQLPKESEQMEINLPTKTIELYNNETSNDEGFDETMSATLSSIRHDASNDGCTNSLDIWDEALNSKKKTVFTWEKQGSYNERLDNGFLSELGDKAFDCMYQIKIGELEKLTGKPLAIKKVSAQKVFQDTLNVLLGVQSTLYTFYPINLSLRPAPNIKCPGVSAESLHALMTKFATLGTNYRQLRKFCSHHADRPKTGQSGGFLLKAFIDALREILQTYWYAVFEAGDMNKAMLLTELWHLFEPFSKQFKLLADMCLCTEAFKRTGEGSAKPKFPVGPRLLSYLYSLAVKNSSTDHYPMLLYLFRCTSIPYINFISDWLFRGVCLDSYGEFFVQLDHQYLSYRDKYFWTQGFQMNQSQTFVPLFLDGLAEEIFACGKSINLLRLTNIKHYLFNIDIKTPNLFVTFSSKRLEEMNKENKRYLNTVKIAEKSHLEEKQRKLLEEKEDWRRRIANEKMINEEALKQIKEAEDEIRKAIRDKKVKELKELQIQFEEAVKQRKKRREKKIEEDLAFLEEVEKIEQKEDDARKKARDDIIAYYEALSEAAEKRERRAKWIIDRYLLSKKRSEFLRQAEDSIQQEVIKAKLSNLELAESSNLMNLSRENLPVDDSSSSDVAETEGLYPESHDAPTSGTSTEIRVPSPETVDSVDHPESLVSGNPDQISFHSAHPETKLAYFKSDQNLSVAKNILYPVGSNSEPGASSYHAQFNAGTGAAERRELLGSSAFEGSTARDILYPSTETETLIDLNISLHNDEGKATKDLLYPGENIHTLTTQPLSSTTHNEGSVTKGLLYPEEFSTRNINSFDNPQAVERQIKDGAETKDLLYGAPSDISAHVSTRGLAVTDGRETKDLLYPIDEFREVVDRSSMKEAEGSETKHLLYPGTLQSQDISKPVPTLYSHNEGSVTKQILYPGENTHEENVVKLRDFEKPSVMKDVLYSGVETQNADINKQKPRGFEPPTRIKEMMYPNLPEKVEFKHEVRELCPEDVWMDLTVEPFQDNFNELINQDPHPYRCWETTKLPLQFEQDKDEDADIIKQMPLETIVKRSLISPIQAQISLVNKAVVQYFIKDLHIEAHFDAFRKFLLLEDGEFGHSLRSQLFEKISSGMRPQEFCNTIRLNNIIIEALRLSLYASRIEYSNQLTFSLKSIPDVFQPSDVGVLDFLELRYQVPWPCNIVITENSINKYNRVFSFLIRLKRAGWSLQEVWLSLKKADYLRKTASSPQLRQLQLFRHEMQHFVNNLERYTVNQIIHVSWQEFQESLSKVNDLDDLHRCHTAYLKKIIFRSLLSKNAAPVYKLINDIFGMISKFETRLTSHSWVEDKETGHMIHPMFAKLQLVHGAFRQCIEFLFSVISKLVRRGYQDHLSDLLLQVNFNSHYKTAILTSLC